MPRTFPVKQSELVTLAAVSNAVPLARRLSREVARHWRLPQELADNNEQVVSELVTNAVKATHDFNQARGLTGVGRVRFRFRWSDPSLFTEVWDINPLLPVPRQASDDDESGRGLGIIEYMCANWSAFHYTEGGKFVWTELRL